MSASTDRSTATGRVSALARRYSTATVLFHQAVASHLGLAPGDHKCLDVLLERGPLTGSEVAAVTGLTTGAVSGVLGRLEASGMVTRSPHPTDGRKQVFATSDRAVQDVQAVFEAAEVADADLLGGLGTTELAAVATWLEQATEHAYRRTARLRAETELAGRRPHVGGGTAA